MKTNLATAIFPLVIVFFALACGGGGGIENSTPPETSLIINKGIYTGSITPGGQTPDSAVGMVTSRNEVAVVDIDTNEFLIGTISGVNISGELYSDVVVTATGEITSSAGGVIIGNYSSSIASGVFNLSDDPALYDRGSLLSRLEGVWVDDTYTDLVGVSTWVIDANGNFSIATTSGCSAVGLFTLDNESINEYRFSGTASNCGSLNGSFSGYGFMADQFNQNDILPIVFTNGAVGSYSIPIKQ